MNPTLSHLPEAAPVQPEQRAVGNALWARYRQGSDIETEGDLVSHYLPLVKTVVGRLAMTLPAHVSLEDLHSAGLVGLLQALRNYRAGTGASFETFARFRIRGAVLDELRRMDWVPRSVHDKARKLQETLSALEQKLGRVPTEEETAKTMKMSLEDYRQLLDDVRPAAFLHLDSLMHPDSADPSPLHECVPDDQQEIPGELASKRELIKLVMDRLEHLPSMQKQVLSLYYCEDMRLKEIAAVFGLTESRISQIHAQAILAIRSFVERHESSPVPL
jgi:RNA polymerase sigma factor for flagellar operon FliA